MVKTIQKINPKKHRYSGFPPISDQRINASLVESFLKRVYKKHTISSDSSGEKWFTVESGVHKGTQFLIDATRGRAEIYFLCSKGEEEYFPNTYECYVVYEEGVQERYFYGFNEISEIDLKVREHRKAMYEAGKTPKKSHKDMRQELQLHGKISEN